MGDMRIMYLSLKTRLLRRLIKEKLYLDKKVVKQKTKLFRYHTEGREISKHLHELVERWVKLSNCTTRLKKTHRDLKNLINEYCYDLCFNPKFIIALFALALSERALEQKVHGL